MKISSSGNAGNSASSVATSYPWSSLNPGSTVVDVGGSVGHVSIAIAEAHPDLNFIVQDRPQVAENAHVGPEVAESVAKRVKFVGHDFLTPQTVVGDVYLFRWIFHAWPDAYVVKILRNLIPALKKGAKVVASDQLMPEPGTVPLVAEREIR
jgi:hypothetical protein